jgi:hypothetical protein
MEEESDRLVRRTTLKEKLMEGRTGLLKQDLDPLFIESGAMPSALVLASRINKPVRRYFVLRKA